ncbi:hypothetical protein KFE96_05445 [Kordiimonas sp. SCSIO 12603]|uniref:3-oxoacyl-ACP synthase III family protein n=1 Tax=Kordiimonas sp. SCSIO 12603 TaxID=2829596 RepID=UPI002102D73D|nr:3-oxoacyl-[acyl-carrier-protein] synthase III C-terminal domain-containing protein [Kordiimonas sp. SCSIO 12603]UTW59749.1 hypothetical protein KFE96_05445 [Kordiimonas sp. SCSIO 12603]
MFDPHFPDADMNFWHNTSELGVAGTGFALPGAPISTPELLAHMEKQFGLECAKRGRIYAEKMNIQHRHIARDLLERREGPREGHSNPDLAAQAIKEALADAGMVVSDLGYIIGHTASPARLIPNNMAFVADKLEYRGPYMELRQACTGFANALAIAYGMLSGPSAKPIAIVGSETGSAYFDPERVKEDAGQLVNLVQMGDAAGAIILVPEGYENKGKLSHSFFGHIGLGREPGFTVLEGGSNAPFTSGDVIEFAHEFGSVRVNGPELFIAGIQASLSIGSGIEDVNHIIPHQANGNMGALMEEHMGMDGSRVFVNAHKRGNTGSAAIWLALAELRKQMVGGETALILGAEATKYLYGGFRYTHGL